MDEPIKRAYASADEAFAALLRRSREQLKLTQEDVAIEMSRRGHDFHQPTIYKIEAGKRRVTVGEAVALAEIVKVPVEELANRYPDSDESLANNVRRAGRDYAEALFDLASQVNGAAIHRMLFVQAVQEYARAPTAYFEYPDETKVPMSELFQPLAMFPGLGDYAVAWRELLAMPEARAVLASVGWDPDEMQDDEFL